MRNLTIRHGLQRTVAALAVAMLPAVAGADASNYNYLQLDYRNGEIGGVDTIGWRVNGSFRFAESFFVQASHQQAALDEDIQDFDLDSDASVLAGGFIFSENATASIYGTIGYREEVDDVQVGVTSSEDTFEGTDFGLGARINLSPEAELKLAANHVDFGDNNEQTIPSAELVYRFSRRVAGSAQYQRKDDFNMYGLGLRVYF